MSFFDEVRRRNVHRVAIFYLAGAWLLIQVVETVFPAFGMTDAGIRAVTMILAIGFVPALIVSWFFEWTAQGLVRDASVSEDTPRTPTKYFDRAITVMLVLAVAYFAVDKFVLDPARDAEMAEEIATHARSEALVESYGERSIAVLPFVNMSSDPEQVFFSDGISEEILNLLAKIEELRVISRSTAFAYRGEVNLSSIAEELNVAYLLEGSVRKAGDKVRVTAQLIEAATDKHVWSETYDRDLTDIFAIQDEVAGRVANELEVRLLNSGQTKHQTDPETYAMYLQARHSFYGQASDRGDKRRQMGLLQRALARDPEFVPAMNLLSHIEWYATNQSDEFSAAEKEQMMQQGFQRIQDAYFKDPNDAVANIYMAFALDRGRQQTAKYVERALVLDPGNIEVLRTSAVFANGIGRFDEAIALAERALAREPMCIPCYSLLAPSFLAAGRYDEAEAVLRRRIALVDDLGGHHNLAYVLLLQGNPEAAFEIFNRIDGIESHWLSSRALALHDLGRHDEVEEMLRRLVENYGDTEAYNIASLYAYTGDSESAIATIEKAIENDPAFFNDWMLWDPFFANLHDTPQWFQWRKDAGLDEETLAAIEFTIPDFGTE